MYYRDLKCHVEVVHCHDHEKCDAHFCVALRKMPASRKKRSRSSKKRPRRSKASSKARYRKAEITSWTQLLNMKITHVPETPAPPSMSVKILLKGSFFTRGETVVVSLNDDEIKYKDKNGAEIQRSKIQKRGIQTLSDQGLNTLKEVEQWLKKRKHDITSQNNLRIRIKTSNRGISDKMDDIFTKYMGSWKDLPTGQRDHQVTHNETFQGNLFEFFKKPPHDTQEVTFTNTFTKGEKTISFQFRREFENGFFKTMIIKYRDLKIEFSRKLSEEQKASILDKLEPINEHEDFVKTHIEEHNKLKGELVALKAEAPPPP